MIDELRVDLDGIVGQEVSGRRMAGNSLILYFGGEPGDVGVTTIWLDPSWRYERCNTPIVGSGDPPWEPDPDESKDEFRLRFDSVCNLVDPLVGSVLTSTSILPNTNDPILEFSGEQRLVGFASTCHERNSDNWGFENGSTDRRYYVNVFGAVVEDDAD